jgi:hypothetical protein
MLRKIHVFYSSPNSIRIIKLMCIQCAGHVANICTKRNVNELGLGNLKVIHQLEDM